MRQCWKIRSRRTGHKIQYGACVLHAGYLRIHRHKHSEYVILIAFQLEQWLNERALMLRYTFVACLFLTCI
jgi:hypothetical protein